MFYFSFWGLILGLLVILGLIVLFFGGAALIIIAKHDMKNPKFEDSMRPKLYIIAGLIMMALSVILFLSLIE